jgi:hypothetical protein
MSSTPSIVASACLGLIALAAPALAGAADAPDLLNDRFNVSLGTFAVRTDTTVRVDGSVTDLGTPIDWEETFGKGDANRFRVDAYWRFADRHKLRALVFDSRANRTVTLDKEIEFDGEFFPVNARVDSEFGFSIYELAYEYAFMRRDRYELAASIGVHYTDLEASISGTVRTPAGAASRSANREASVGAPLPVVGLRGTWALPGNLWLGASAQVFKLSVGDYGGSLQDLRVALHWQPKRWLGIGVGYNRFALDVDATAKDFTGTLDWVYEGPIVFYNVSF